MKNMVCVAGSPATQDFFFGCREWEVMRLLPVTYHHDARHDPQVGNLYDTERRLD